MKVEESYVTNLTKFYIVILLREKPRHGYDIIDEIGKRLGKKPSAGQIYPLLESLKKKGLIKSEIIGKKKLYHLTKKGEAFSDSLIEKFSDMIRIAIKKNLTACAHCNCEIYKGVYKKRNLSFCCRNCADAYKTA